MTTRERAFTFATDRGQFSHLYRAIDEVAGDLRMSVEEQFRFALCISEAYTNAFLHGNGQNASKSINVRFVWDGSSVRIDIEDEGDATVDQIDLGNASVRVPGENGSGRGIGIIKKYADKITIEQRQEGGIRVSIFWALKSKIAESVATR